jgi:hypothetical protein
VTSFFVLTSAEAMATAEAIEALRPLSWSAALLERAGERGGLSTNNMATLFEVRFGRALRDCGVAPIILRFGFAKDANLISG